MFLSPWGCVLGATGYSVIVELGGFSRMKDVWLEPDLSLVSFVLRPSWSDSAFWPSRVTVSVRWTVLVGRRGRWLGREGEVAGQMGGG